MSWLNLTLCITESELPCRDSREYKKFTATSNDGLWTVQGELLQFEDGMLDVAVGQAVQIQVSPQMTHHQLAEFLDSDAAEEYPLSCNLLHGRVITYQHDHHWTASCGGWLWSVSGPVAHTSNIALHQLLSICVSQ